MQLKDEDIKHIKKAFESLQSKEDFLALINYSKRILFGKNSIDIEMKQFNYHLANKNKNSYTLFSIAKKNGGKRNIHAPNKGLKIIQYCLNLILQTVFQPHKAVFGFVPGKSIDDNAALHIGSHYFYNIDLKDFFPSITQARVYSKSTI